MNTIDKLRSSNQRLGEYKAIRGKKRDIVSSNLAYFLAIGVFYMGLSFTTGTGQSKEPINLYQYGTLFTMLATFLSIAIVIALKTWELNIQRAVAEKVANKDLKLLESSFLPEFDNQFFNRGIKYLVAELLLGLVVAGFTYLSIVILGLFALGGVMGTVGSLITGLFTGILILILIVLLVVLIVAPITIPLSTIYVYFGDDIGIIESIKLTLNIGFKNYGKLALLMLKIIGINILGLMALGIGVFYTLPLTMIMQLDEVSEILGVSLKENHTFKTPIKEPNNKVNEPVTKKEPIIEEEPVIKEEPILEEKEEPIIEEEPIVEEEPVSQEEDIHREWEEEEITEEDKDGIKESDKEVESEDK